MARLTKDLVKRALAENGVSHSSRAKLGELLQLYDGIAVEVRRDFEERNGLNIVPERVIVEDGSDDENDDDVDDAENENNGESGGGTDESEGEDMAAVDEKLALLKKKHEIMMLRTSIREMKEKAAAAAVLAASEATRNTVSAAQPAAVSNTSATTAEVVDTRGPVFPVTLPMGVRMTPSPQAAVALPNNSRRIDYRDIEHAIIKFSGDDATHDVRTFLRSFEEMMELINADETFRLLSLRRSLDGAAQTLLYTADASTFTTLRKALIEEFGESMTPADIEAVLRRRRWTRPETLHRYVLEMQRLYGRMGLERLTEKKVVDLIIDNLGLPTHQVSFLRGTNTIRDLKENLKRYEDIIKAAADSAATAAAGRAQSRSNDASARPSAVAVARPGSQATARVNTGASAGRRTTPSAAVNNDVRCYNCSKNGHYKGDCPYEVRPPNVCYRCWQTGHLHGTCPNQKRVQKLLSEVHVVHAEQPEAPAEPLIDWNDADTLREGIASINLVSVAFRKKLNQYTGFNQCVSLFDTGSPISFVRRAAIPFSITEDKTATGLRGLGGPALKTHGAVICRVKFNQRVRLLKLLILPDEATTMPLILGRDFLKLFGIVLAQPKLMYTRTKLLSLNKERGTTVPNLPHSRVLDLNTFSRMKQLDLLRPNKPVMENATPHSTPKGNESLIFHEEGFGPEFAMPQIYAIDMVEKETALDIGENLTQAERTEVERMIEENYLSPKDIEVEPYDYEMDIHLTNDVPFHHPPRRLSYMEKAVVQTKICELIEEGIIAPSDSPYASAIVLVKKKDGSTRMCIDYRALNKLTVRDNYPLPLIDDCVDYMKGKRYFTLLDLKSGFHQVKVSPKSMKFTAFVTPHGQYEYRRMPFGLKNAPAVFQRFVNQVFRDFLEKGEIIIYMDDILLATADWETHKRLLRKILRRLARRGLLLNMKKCRFGCERIEYLGYSVNADGIRPSDAHIAAIREYPMPRNAKEVHSCIGLFSYFRRFVRDFSRIARPMQNLLKEGTVFDFDDACQGAFHTLKDSLTSSPVLAIYDPTKETELHCDASSRGFGATLMQRQDDGKFHPTAYFSRSTTAAESKCHSFELETMAVYYALERFRIYLEGIHFTLVTDCNSLALTLDRKQVNPKIARWALEFSKYTFSKRHQPGLSMGHVDALSRCHQERAAETMAAPVATSKRGQATETIDESEPKRVEVMSTDVLSTEFQLQLAQSRDHKMEALRKELEDGEKEGYELSNGIVYRRMADGRLQFYVPDEMEDNVIRVVHEKLAHQSVDKCYAKLSEQYWFPQMRSKIRAFIDRCVKCIMHAAPVRISEQNLYCIPKAPIPFDTIHIDHYGPLPSLMNKRKHILAVVDAFTKYVKLFAVNATSTREVIASLEKYFAFYGRPRRIVSDRGTCFTSLEFAQFIVKNNIAHTKVATASPQANGQVERTNRVLSAALGKMSEPLRHADWSQKLLEVEYALNNSKHATTKETPSKLLFGVEQRGKIVDEMTEYLAAESGDPRIDLETAREKARENIEKTQKYQEERRRQKCKPTKKFEAGDYVVIRNVDTVVGTNKKLIPKYRGPYIVSKTLDHDRYVVKDIEGCQLRQLPYNGIVEANKMRGWIPTRKVESDGGNSSESDTEEDGLLAESDSEEEEDFRGFPPN